ncbi:hypothetical protein CLOM_g15916, partial [Closterium sp. NIES-68]
LLQSNFLTISSPCHPQTDGQTEHLNRIVEQLLRAACKDGISKWDLHLLVLEFAHKNATNAATGQTPFFLCYGRHPITPQYPTIPSTVEPAHDFITTMHKLWDRTHKPLLDIQQQQKRQADRHRTDHTITVGDRVPLDTRNLDIGHLPSKLILACSTVSPSNHVTRSRELTKFSTNFMESGFFAKIDLRRGYYQNRVAAKDCHKTAFRTRYGSYEYLMIMNENFRKLLDKCVIIYLDNILINSRSKEQHFKVLDAVFTLLHKNRLIVKGSKCDFLKQELEFLGHIVSTDGVKIDPKKIKTTQEWKPPRNVKELRSFLGFVNYVRRFIPNMAGFSAPLTDRLKDHDCFWWVEKQQAPFDQLKIALTLLLVLHISAPDRPYEVITHASDIAIGAALLQDFGEGLQPVAYESQKLHGGEKIYTVHDKEMLAVVHVLPNRS